MSKFYRYTNLVTKGNFPLVPAGQPVVSPNEGELYNFEAGRMIVYDPTKMITLDDAGIATAKKVRIGVGHNPKGGYIATQIRHIGGQDIDLCKTNLDINVDAPECATPQVIDFEFDCTFTGEDYGVQIDIDDWLRRSYFKEGAYPMMYYNLRTDFSACDKCVEEENCTHLACQLADKINEEFIKHYPGTSKLGLNTNGPNHGLWAVQKFTNTLTYELDPPAAPDECGGPCAVKSLVAIKIGSGAKVEFTHATDPSDPDRTLFTQLPNIIRQINNLIKGKGSAYLKKLDCCTYSIEINTCISDDIKLYYNDSDGYYSASSTNAFEAVAGDSECIGCDSPGSRTFSCGIRLYVNPLELPCHCEYPNGNPPSYYGRTARIVPVGDGWDNTPSRVVEIESQEVWRGTGFQVQLNEIRQSQGGEGFDFNFGMDYSEDRVPLPSPGSALAESSVAKCDELYCIWSVKTTNFMAASHINRMVHNSQTVNWVNIPTGDTNTISDFEDILTALDARGLCNSVQISCSDGEGRE